MVWLLSSQGMKNYKNTESFCHNILATYKNACPTFWYIYCCYVYYSFSGKFLNVCRPRTTYPLWQPGPLRLAFYGSGQACLPSWLGMVNAAWWWMQVGSVACDQKFSCKWNLSFLRLSHQVNFLLAQLAPYNQFLTQPL